MKVTSKKIGHGYDAWRNGCLTIPLKTHGVSPNTQLFGNAFAIDPTLLTQIDRDVFDV